MKKYTHTHNILLCRINRDLKCHSFSFFACVFSETYVIRSDWWQFNSMHNQNEM